MLVGCNREEPNGYFATGENTHRPYTALECGYLAGSYERDTGRTASRCLGPTAKDVVGEAMKPGRSPNDFSKE
jgi:hypothetical protein